MSDLFLAGYLGGRMGKGGFLAAALVALAFAATAGAQDRATKPRPDHPASGVPETAANTSRPVAAVDSFVHDFQTVWLDEKLEHAFTIRNTGDASLRIVKVKAACGCTRAGEHPQLIAPGESGKFPFRINVSKLYGRFNKAIDITTNDPGHRQLAFTLSGVVRHYVDVKPRAVAFGRVKADSVLTRKLTLSNNTDQKLEVSIDRTEDMGCFEADLAELVAGQEYEVTVTAQPPYKTGWNRHSLIINTNVEQQRELAVNCTAELLQRLDVKPNSIAVSPAAKTQTVRKVLFVNNGETPVNLVSVSVSDKRLAVQSKEIAAGKRHQITVTIPPKFTPLAEGSAVVLATDDAEFPELRVPIRASAPRTARKNRQRKAMTLLGQEVPGHRATTFRGEGMKIGGKSDKVQVVAFYVSWCGFCKRAMPKVEQLHRRFAETNKHVSVIAVNQDSRTGRRGRTKQQIVEKSEEWGLTMPLILDGAKKIGTPFKVTHYPTIFVLGKSGVVEAVHVGLRGDFQKTIASEVESLLAGRTLKPDKPEDQAEK